MSVPARAKLEAASSKRRAQSGELAPPETASCCLGDCLERLEGRPLGDWLASVLARARHRRQRPKVGPDEEARVGLFFKGRRCAEAAD